PKLPKIKKGITLRQIQAPSNPQIMDATSIIVKVLEPLSLFRLHKLLYLAEVESRDLFKEPFLGMYFIRQKDGPYSPTLRKYLQYLLTQNISVRRSADGPILFSTSKMLRNSLTPNQRMILESIRRKYGRLSNTGVKIAAYRRGPMSELVVLQKR